MQAMHGETERFKYARNENMELTPNENQKPIKMIPFQITCPSGTPSHHITPNRIKFV